MNESITTIVCLYTAIGGIVYLLNSTRLSPEEAKRQLTTDRIIKEYFFWPAYIWPFKKSTGA